jgi:hypothetical protein
MSEFFVLEPVDGYFGTKWAYGEEVDPVYLGDVDRCPVCNQAVSLKKGLPPYRIKLSSGRAEKWGDLLWIGGTTLAFSRRFKDLFEHQRLKGIDSSSGPIEIVRYGARKENELSITHPQYYIIHVPWGGANQDDKSSEVIHRIPEAITCSYCRIGLSKRRQPRIMLDLDSWDGSDIFRARGAMAQYMVSEKFRMVCKENRIRNALLIPGKEYGWDSERSGLWYLNKTKDEPTG